MTTFEFGWLDKRDQRAFVTQVDLEYAWLDSGVLQAARERIACQKLSGIADAQHVDIIAARQMR